MSIRSDVLHGSAACVASGFFGNTAGGERVFLHTLANGGITVRCLDFGGAVHSIEIPDRSGRAENVVLGFDGLKDYEHDRSWCGVLCGPVAGRVAGASVPLGEKVLSLEANEGTTCLHSGSAGFSKSVWKGMTFCDGRIAGVRFSLSTLPGEWGFPGVLSMKAVYTLDGGGRLSLEWEAWSSEDTLFAPTFHGYFNLGGPASVSVEDHRLLLRAGRYMPLDGHSLPRLPEPVGGTPFDFRSPRAPLPAEMFDHPFLPDEGRGADAPCAVLDHLPSGRRMELFTDQPAVVFYGGRSLSPDQVFSGGRQGRPGLALALEPQWYPNAASLPGLSLPVLRKGERYTARSEWRFSLLPE